MTEPIKLLTIAGADSGGAVGLQADLRTFAALGAYGLSGLTVVTAQNSLGVTAVSPLPPAFLAAQLDAVLSDFGVVGRGIQGVKTGFLAQTALIDVVVEKLAAYRPPVFVVDPVLVNYEGVPMFPAEVVAAYKTKLLPLATAVLPNRHEVALLAGVPEMKSLAQFETAVRHIQQLGPRYVLGKGFPVGEQLVDVLYDGQQMRHFPVPKLATNNRKGSGDTLSAALCVFLARGEAMETAVWHAQQFTQQALQKAASWQLGQGAGPLAQWLVGD